MTDHYTHLRLASADPLANLRSLMAAGGVAEAMVVETLDGSNRGQLDRIAFDPEPGLRAVYCWHNGAELESLRRPAVAGLRVRTADLNEPGAWVDALRNSGGTLYIHADAAPGVLARRLAEFAGKHPGIPILVPHMAWPRRDGLDDPEWPEAISVLSGLPVTVAISAIAHFSSEAFPHVDVERFASRIVDAFGPGRVVAGSDYPFSCRDDYTRYIALAAQWRDHRCPTH